VRRERAESKFWEKIREKRNHRETPYRDESFGESYSQIASLYNSDTNTRNVVITNPTQSVEPKAKVIAFPVENSKTTIKKTKPGGILNSEQFDSLEF
jgi:hypothetical protein